MYCNVLIKEKQYKVYCEVPAVDERPVLLLLHGWGVDSSVFKKIINHLNFRTIVVDFIGFGKSDHPDCVFALDDYVEMVTQLVLSLHLKDITLLGHSFGGRVAIKYCLKHSVKSLILVDSAGIKNNSRRLKWTISKYKIKKAWFKVFNKEKYQQLVSTSGSKDYQVLDPIMKQTMTKIINEDLKKCLAEIKIRTIIIWGIDDQETPLSQAYIFYELLSNSRLFLFYHSGHFPFIDEEKKFIQLLNEVK